MSGTSVPYLVQYTPGSGVISAASLNTFIQGGCYLANLRAFTGLPNQNVQLIGFTSQNDGGQGTFVWSSNVGTDDGGITTIVPYGVVQGCWLRQIPGYLNAVTAVTNIAALRMQTSATVTGAVVFVEGYYGGADGGEGLFWQNASDISSADNGGTIIVDASQRRWYRETGANPYNICWFGAQGGGVDNTSAVNACIAAAVAGGRSVYIPSGTWTVTELTSVLNLNLRGDGHNVSILQTSLTDANLLTVTGTLEVNGVQFAAASQAVTGAFITTSGSDHYIIDCAFNNYATAIYATANTGIIQNCHFSNPVVNTGVGIYVSGYAGGLMIDNILMYVPSVVPFAGIQIVQAGAVQIDNCQILSQGNCLYINPGSGQGVASVFATNTFFDSAQLTGALISPASGQSGNVIRCRFLGCWFSSAKNNGVVVASTGTGVVSGIDFDSCMMVLNAANGLAVTGGTSVNVNAGLYAANGLCGIAYGAGVSSFTVNGAIAGGYAGIPGNADYGVIVTAGASNDYIISLCRAGFNGIGGVSDGGTGTTKFVGNNIL